MFEFTDKEKQSIRFFVDTFRHHYKSDKIYSKIDNDSLTKDDLKALDSKVRTLMQGFSDDRFLSTADGVNYLITLGQNAEIVLTALSRYRSDDFDPDKLMNNYWKRKGKASK